MHGRITRQTEQYAQVTNRPLIDVLQVNKVPLEILRNTAARFSMATQLMSLRDSMATRVSSIEKTHPSLELLQIDKTPLHIFKEQAKQFTTTVPLWQLSQLPQATLCLSHQKQQSSTPYQTLERLTTMPEPLRYLAEQGRELTEYNALEWLSEYLQTPVPPLRTRPVALQKFAARPELLQTMQDSATDVIEYDALYTIWQELYQQVERRKALKIQAEEARRHNAQNFLFQLPFLTITDDFRIECENMVNGLLEKARREPHNDINTRETPQKLNARQDTALHGTDETFNEIPHMGM